MTDQEYEQLLESKDFKIINKSELCFDWEYKDDVDEIFHRQLCECAKQEQEYFKTHDEYEILKSSFSKEIGFLFSSFPIVVEVVVADEPVELPPLVEKISGLIFNIC